jgi:hypothetical protein
MATYQIDWWHVLVKVQRTFNDQPGLVSELVNYLYKGKGEVLVTCSGAMEKISM